MKIYPYLLTALIVCSISCRKDAPIKVEPSANPYLLQQAKDWYSNQRLLTTTPGSVDLKTYTPDWSKAQIVKNIDGQDIIGVPLSNSPQSYIELNVLAENGKNYGIIKQYLLDKKLLNVYRDGGRFLESRRYDMHKFNNFPKFRILRAPSSRVPGDDDPIGGGEDPIELPVVIVTAPGDNHPFDPNEHAIHFPSSPVGGPQAPFNPPHGGGGGGSPTPVEPATASADITNNVQDPCLKAVVNTLKNSNIAGKISDIISALDENTKVQINVVDAPEVYNSNGESIAAKFQANPTSTTNIFSGTITISINTLSISTKENTAATIVHEIVHAYFAYTGQNNKLSSIEHQKMATDYIQPMTNFLSGLYNIPIKDATALAWTGLRNANSYINSTNFDYPGGTMTKDEVGDIYRNYVTKY